MSAIADFVSDVPASSKMGAVLPYLHPTDVGSAIDIYLRRVRETLVYGSPDRLNENDFVGRLLVLGLVAAAESYFREVLSASMAICPIARAGASVRTINLGSVMWHGHGGYIRSAFDNSSFSSVDGLKKAASEYVGFKMPDSIFGSLLPEYEKVCNLRHSIVHGDGILPGKNAVNLDVPPQKKPMKMVVRFDELQEIASVLTTLVVTFNRELFEIMCLRWAIEWRKRPDWDPKLEMKLFSSLWTVFLCAEQNKAKKGKAKGTRAGCLAAVKLRYGI